MRVIYFFMTAVLLFSSAQAQLQDEGAIFEGIIANDFKIVDWDGDSDDDIVFNGYNYELKAGQSFLGWYENAGFGQYEPIKTLSLDSYANLSNFEVIDIDNDDDLDVLINPLTSTNGHTYFLINEEGGFSKSPIVDEIWYSRTALVDIDNDLLLDVVGVHNGELHYLNNDGDGSFSAVTSFGSGLSSTWSIQSAKLDGDDFEDIILLSNGNVSWIKNNGDGTLGPDGDGSFELIHSGSATTGFVEVGYFNADSFLDLLISDHDGEIYTYLNDGLGDFTTSGVLVDSDVTDYSVIEVEDYTNDGIADIWVKYEDEEEYEFIKLYVNDGSGGFDLVNTEAEPGPIENILYVLSADFDGDGDIDILRSDHSNQHIGLFRNEVIPTPQAFNTEKKGAFVRMQCEDIPSFDGGATLSTCTDAGSMQFVNDKLYMLLAEAAFAGGMETDWHVVVRDEFGDWSTVVMTGGISAASSALLPNEHKPAFLVSSDERYVLIGTNKGLHVYDQLLFRWTVLGADDGINGGTVQAIVELSNGDFLIAAGQAIQRLSGSAIVETVKITADDGVDIYDMYVTSGDVVYATSGTETQQDNFLTRWNNDAIEQINFESLMRQAHLIEWGEGHLAMMPEHDNKLYLYQNGVWSQVPFEGTGTGYRLSPLSSGNLLIVGNTNQDAWTYDPYTQTSTYLGLSYFYKLNSQAVTQDGVTYFNFGQYTSTFEAYAEDLKINLGQMGGLVRFENIIDGLKGTYVAEELDLSLLPSVVGAENHFTYELVEGEGDNHNVSFFIDGSILKNSNALDLSIESHKIRIRATSTYDPSVVIEQWFLLTTCDVEEGLGEAESCDSYRWNGKTYMQSGEFSQLLQSSIGCDSLATLTLTILQSTVSEETVSACDSYEWNSMTYSTSGTYYEHLTNSVGCDSTATLHLTILSSETQFVDVETCEGFSFDGSFLTSTGEYTATFTNQVGCDSLVNLSLTILEQPDPTISLNGVILFANEQEGVTYQWVDCDSGEALEGDTKKQLTPKRAGFYSVEISNGNCTVVSDCMNSEGEILDVDEFKSQIRAYPNPTQSLVQLDLGQMYDQIEVEVLTITGHIIRATALSYVEKIAVDLSEKKGVYFIRVTSREHLLQTLRVIKD